MKLQYFINFFIGIFDGLVWPKILELVPELGLAGYITTGLQRSKYENSVYRIQIIDTIL